MPPRRSGTSVLDKLKPQFTDFGKHVYALMLDRDVLTFDALRAELANRGLHFHRQTLTNYFTGRNEAPPRFVRGLTDVLGLTKDERRESVDLYVYGPSEEE